MINVLIHNDSTGTVGIENYNVRVLVNDEVIASGRIEGFPRLNGWRNLLLAVASEKVCGGPYSVMEVNNASQKVHERSGSSLGNRDSGKVRTKSNNKVRGRKSPS